MVRIGRRLVSRQMARRAGRRIQSVVIVDVTLRARRCQMRPSECKAGFRVVERGRLPGRRVVAYIAGLRESGCHMIGVRRLIEIRDMTACALDRQGQVVIVHVAQRALSREVRSGQRERGFRVVERRTQPVDRRVTLRAVRREPRGGVVRVGRRIIRSQMACRASRRIQGVVIVDVTLSAGRGQMRSGECKSRLGVVKCGRIPRRCCVTRVAGLREAGCHMIGVRRIVEIRNMAARALKRQGGVVIVHMAQRALSRDMRAGQRKRGLGVIEYGRLPCGRVVAYFAGLREAGRHMIGVRRLVEIRHMTTRALSRQARIVVVHVAQRALRRDVRPSQWEHGLGMVKSRAQPVHGRVAQRAVRREPSGDMVWIGRRVVGRQMACRASRRAQRVVVVYVTLRARRGQMRPGERKSCLGVIECRRIPRRCVVAGIASLREAGRHMIGVRRSVEIRNMAARALNRQGRVVVIHVTHRALEGGVRAGQWERG